MTQGVYKHSQSHKDKAREVLMKHNNRHLQSSKDWMSAHMKSKDHNNKKQHKVTCPVCGKTMYKGLAVRWGHDEGCNNTV